MQGRQERKISKPLLQNIVPSQKEALLRQKKQTKIRSSRVLNAVSLQGRVTLESWSACWLDASNLCEEPFKKRPFCNIKVRIVIKIFLSNKVDIYLFCKAMASLKKQRFGIKYLLDISGFAKFGQFFLTKKKTIIQITKLPDLPNISGAL